jgi:hypothetical protein
MTTYPRTPTNVEVTVLDVTTVNEAMTDAYSDPDTTVEVSFGPYGFVETPKGVFVLNNEGIGTGPLDDDEVYEFDGYAHTANSFGIMPVMTAKVPVFALVKMATDRKVNLAEFVRTFGARLDNNYEDNRRAIEAARA